MKFFLRLLGYLVLAVAFIAAVVDASKTVAAGKLVLTPLGQAWFDLHSASLNLMQAVIQRYVAPVIWDPVVVSVLLLPSWAVFGVIALLLLLAGRRRRGSVAVIND